MIDLETMGRAPKGAIVSIGAVAFDYTGKIGDTFKVNTKFAGREVDEETVRWWLEQSPEALKGLRVPAAIPLEEGLAHLRKFFEPHHRPDVWANGVMFDLAILRDAMGGATPWGYKQELCMRPVRKIGEMLGVSWEGAPTGVGHDALDDAIAQAAYVVKVLERVRRGPGEFSV
jgi:DNA polymerase III epsilon subunit-like protein